MKRFIIEQSEKEFYTSHSGLAPGSSPGQALVGLCVNELCSLTDKAREAFPVSAASNGIGLDDILRSYIGYLDVSAEYEDLFEVKLDILGRLVKEQQKRGQRLESPLDVHKLVQITPRFEKFADFPVELDFLLELGGLTWIGTYGPISKWKEGIKQGMQLMEGYGFPPIVVTRPMQGGHFGVLRFIAVFDKSDSERVNRVTRLNEALSDLVMALGFFPYKTPPWVVHRHRDKIEANFLTLLGKVRKLLDPGGIMNPGKWPV